MKNGNNIEKNENSSSNSVFNVVGKRKWKFEFRFLMLGKRKTKIEVRIQFSHVMSTFKRTARKI